MKGLVFAVVMAGLLVLMGCEKPKPPSANSESSAIEISDEAQALFDFIEKDVVASGKPVIVSMDLDSSTEDECLPIAKAVLRHCFLRNIPVIVTTFLITSEGLCRQVMDKTSRDCDAQYGKDYVFLGFKPNYPQMILATGRNFSSVYRTDADGNDIKSMDATKNIENFDDIGLVVAISGTDIPVAWIIFANGEYGVPVAVGTTEVSCTQYKLYFQDGKIKGVLSGSSDVRAYEQMLQRLEKK